MPCCGYSPKPAQAIPNMPLEGLSMPLVGQGLATHEKLAAGQVQTMIEQAIDVGHRHFISTPGDFEGEVGNALRNKVGDGTIDVGDLFVTSKLKNTHHAKAQVRVCLLNTLKSLGLSKLQMYVIDSPCAIKEDGTPDDIDLLETWRALEELYTEGLIRAIGVANFSEAQILRILAVCKIRPVVAMIECHPYFIQHDYIEFCHNREIAVLAYGVLGFPCRPDKPRSEPRLIDNPVIKNMAELKDKTPAQIVLRYLMQMGVAMVTRGCVPNQMIQNRTIFDMTLSSKNERKLKELDVKKRYIMLENLRCHKEYPFPKNRKRKTYAEKQTPQNTFTMT